MSKQWCILRCAGQNTLPLMRSLTKAGFDCWTPVETITKRVPRANVKRKIEQAMMPGYLFASATALVELLILSRTPAKRGQGFRLLRAADDAPALIHESTLAPARMIERKRQVVPASNLPKAGRSYRLTGLGFDGLRGVVIRCSAKYCTVQVDGFAEPLQVSPWLLSEAA